MAASVDWTLSLAGLHSTRPASTTGWAPASSPTSRRGIHLTESRAELLRCRSESARAATGSGSNTLRVGSRFDAPHLKYFCMSEVRRVKSNQQASSLPSGVLQSFEHEGRVGQRLPALRQLTAPDLTANRVPFEMARGLLCRERACPASGVER
jgi:hypothetical protein